MSNVNVTLVGKQGCHLCDDAREVVDSVIAEFPPGSITLTEESIDENKELFDAYWEQIPVVLINGKVHNYWRIDGERLRLKLKELQ